MWRRDPSVVFMSVAVMLLALSASLNVLQAGRIRSLLAPNSPVPARIGQPAPVLAGFSLAGAPVEVTLQSAVPTVVYFFSTTCGWCERNWDNLVALDRAKGERYRVIAVSSQTGLAEFMRARHLELDVIEGMREDTRKGFGFAGTPQTLVVSSDGVITHEWRGAFTPRIERQLEELFGVVLPGLTLPD